LPNRLTWRVAALAAVLGGGRALPSAGRAGGGAGSCGYLGALVDGFRPFFGRFPSSSPSESGLLAFN